jgi:hypothetical protein
MRMLAIAAMGFLLPMAASSATRSYQVAAFDKVSVAAGVRVEIAQGATRSVVADTSADDFDDLRIVVKAGELRIDRPPGNWFHFGRRTNYTVRVTMPSLREMEVSSGSNVNVKGAFAGDFEVSTSSGSHVEIAQLKGRKVRARSSSGSALEVAGSCQSLDAETSSGSNINAGTLMCESATVDASSGSAAKVAATQGLTASASSGASVRVNGSPTVVKVRKSSGGRVVVSRPTE